MVPGRDSDDSNVIVVSASGAFDALNKTSQLYLPIRSGACDEELKNALLTKQILLQNNLEKQQAEKVVLIQNSSFVSQYSYEEKVDVISSWFVHNISRIIVILLALALMFLVIYLKKKNFLMTKSSH